MQMTEIHSEISSTAWNTEFHYIVNKADRKSQAWNGLQ